jgi:hypothetical protein
MPATLIVNPSNDAAFVEAVEAARKDAATIIELESRLGVRYPRATVRARQLSGETAEVWYVYRDGSWTDPRSERG